MSIEICSKCGKEMDFGGFMVDDGWSYICEDCMDKEMEAGNMRYSQCPDENSEGGYYDELVNGEWVAANIFYTEWWMC